MAGGPPFLIWVPHPFRLQARGWAQGSGKVQYRGPDSTEFYILTERKGQAWCPRLASIVWTLTLWQAQGRLWGTTSGQNPSRAEPYPNEPATRGARRGPRFARS